MVFVLVLPLLITNSIKSPCPLLKLKENLEVFFDNNLESQNYGFGLQTGLVINRKLRLVFLLNQFLSYSVRETTGIPVLRFSLGYRFRT